MIDNLIEVIFVLLKALELGLSDEFDIERKGTSVAERALKWKKKTSSKALKLYRDLIFLLPTSNPYERLFSPADYVLSDRRKGIDPSQIEAETFLFKNNDLGHTRDVNKAIVS